MVFELVYWRVPPPNEIVPDEPIALAEPKLKTPALIFIAPDVELFPDIVKLPTLSVVLPEYELFPLNVNVPAPDLRSDPPELVSPVAHVTFWPLISTL